MTLLIYRYVLLVLCAFRLQRIVTTDVWPPTRAFRDFLERKGREPSPSLKKYDGTSGRVQLLRDLKRARWWAEAHQLFSCPWCFGTWCTLGLLLFDHFVYAFPLWSLEVGAATALVGLIGSRDD